MLQLLQCFENTKNFIKTWKKAKNKKCQQKNSGVCGHCDLRHYMSTLATDISICELLPKNNQNRLKKEDQDPSKLTAYNYNNKRHFIN